MASHLKSIWRRASLRIKALVTFYDAAIGAACMMAVMLGRYALEDKPVPDLMHVKATFVMFVCVIGAWIFTGVHKAVWRFTSFNDVQRLGWAVIVANVLTALVLFIFFDRADGFPRSVPLLHGVLFFLLLLVSRTVALLLHSGDIRALTRRTEQNLPQALLLGSSMSLDLYLRDMMRRETGPQFRLHGLIELGSDHEGRSIRGYPVLGGPSDVKATLSSMKRMNGKAPMLVLVDPTIDRHEAYRLVRMASDAGTQLVRAQSGAGGALTPFEAADLIGRQVKALDLSPVLKMVRGKRVLVTGAGGTIGSELTRQLAVLEPAKLILVEQSELALYEIDRELTWMDGADWTAYLGNIREPKRMAEIFEAERPHIVLHAAALKHVPLMETNPLEAVLTNIGGTQEVMRAAEKAGVKSFTLISTDKAVRPTNVMGASKRIAEMLVLSESSNGSKMKTCAVRFGNVLGSAGSVVPLFERQIAEGGPVTVTHPEATRFFMTTEEAASLVLQASSLSRSVKNKEGAIYVLEMGEPVNITRLARQLIRLRGRVPDKDIKIIHTGLRPGEKLTEELTGEMENLGVTPVDGILRFKGRVIDPDSVLRRVDKLLSAAEKRDTEKVYKILKDLIPEFEGRYDLS